MEINTAINTMKNAKNGTTIEGRDGVRITGVILCENKKPAAAAMKNDAAEKNS